MTGTNGGERPGLASLEIDDWSQWLEAHRKTPGQMLRIQTLDHYGVPSDDQDYLGYLSGTPAPVSPYREPWFQRGLSRYVRAPGTVRGLRREGTHYHRGRSDHWIAFWMQTAATGAAETAVCIQNAAVAGRCW